MGHAGGTWVQDPLGIDILAKAACALCPQISPASLSQRLLPLYVAGTWAKDDCAMPGGEVAVVPCPHGQQNRMSAWASSPGKMSVDGSCRLGHVGCAGSTHSWTQLTSIQTKNAKEGKPNLEVDSRPACPPPR